MPAKPSPYSEVRKRVSNRLKTASTGRIKRPQSYAKLKKRLDAVVSLFVRQRFADSSGNVACVCCGAVKHWKQQQCGHYVKRSHLATRWLLDNLAVCCYRCNVLMSGNYPAFSAWGVDRYGMDWPARMVALSRVPTKYSRSQLQDMITDYEQRLARLTGDERE